VATKAEQTERTRAALIDAGRALFASQGFAATSTEELVRTAGVTRGALYHHFRDKRDLFEAVYEAVESDLGARIASVLGGVTEPMQVLRRGVAAFLDACVEPDVQRIALLEAPTVLGYDRWRELDQAHGLGLVRLALQNAMNAGAIRKAPIEPLAHVMFGALMEAGMLVAASATPTQTRREAGRVIEALLEGLAVG
jgi:AcrR family transcriptional regulator